MAIQYYWNRKFYDAWKHMIQRCSNPKSKGFEHYGGRGIKVCKRWLKYENFKKDMWGQFEEGLTLDRIDSNKNYSPSNCRWSTWEVQSNNRRNNRRFQYKGKFLTLSEWSKYFGIKRSTLAQRFYVYGWSTERLFNGGGK